MIKLWQAALLILGGVIGLFGIAVQLQESEWLMALFLASATIAAFALGAWLARQGIKEVKW